MLDEIPVRPEGDPGSQFLCLTICGYKRPGMSEVDYRNHMTKVSAPMTKGLMVKYGVKRWTMVSLMSCTHLMALADTSSTRYTTPPRRVP